MSAAIAFDDRKAHPMSTKRTQRAAVIGGVAAAAVAVLATSPAHAETEVAEPDSFTSAFTVMATPDQVVDGDGNAAPGQEGAMGQYNFRINSDLEIICYDITLTGVSGDYQSAAKTATHLHEAVAGESGPPRISFPNPEPIGDAPRTSSGCLQGPFTTGVTNDEDVDTGDGFSLAQIEANPAGFTGDSHTVDFVPGVVRGQLEQVPVGGVSTGGGGASSESGVPVAAGAAGVATVGVLGALGFMLTRRLRGSIG